MYIPPTHNLIPRHRLSGRPSPGFGTGAIVGIVIGSVTGALAIGFVIFACIRRRRAYSKVRKSDGRGRRYRRIPWRPVSGADDDGLDVRRPDIRGGSGEVLYSGKVAVLVLVDSKALADPSGLSSRALFWLVPAGCGRCHRHLAPVLPEPPSCPFRVAVSKRAYFSWRHVRHDGYSIFHQHRPLGTRPRLIGRAHWRALTPERPTFCRKDEMRRY